MWCCVLQMQTIPMPQYLKLILRMLYFKFHIPNVKRSEIYLFFKSIETFSYSSAYTYNLLLQEFPAEF